MMTTLFVPGRLCLFGEHSDWAGALRAVDPSIVPGACIVTGTNQGITATAEPARDFEITSRLPDGRVLGPLRLPMDAAALWRAAEAGDFFSYAAGVAAALYVRYRPPGLRIVATDLDLPIRRGLSSSAAVCVLVARAFNQVHHLGLSVRDEMDIAYRGEIGAGSQCGRMDQACAYGKRPVLLRFDGDAMDIELLRPHAAVHLVIIDLMCGKDTRRILSDLHRCFLSPQEGGALRAALGVQNQELTEHARAALEAGDARRLGELMTEAQQLFDRCVAPACPAELTAPRLHAVLAHPAVRDFTWGGKGVGSQGDGTAQFVCRGVEERDMLTGRLVADCHVRCLPLTIEPRE
jgi:galactokinase